MLNSSSRRNSIIQAILNALQIKSPWEEVHSKRVSLICQDIGKAYHLKEDEIEALRAAGELHDIGMITVDEAIIGKTGTLTNAEWSEIRRHPETGYRLLSSTTAFNNIAEYIFEHHERWDGTGYPKGLKGESIQWKARVIAIADAYDAMTNNRSYRKALSEAAAVDEVKKHAGTQFDPEIARIFIEKVLGYKW
jgi:HD-GYP domain-containing protein (c-di-GMP phosphodiesterase class II)